MFQIQFKYSYNVRKKTCLSGVLEKEKRNEGEFWNMVKREE